MNRRRLLLVMLGLGPLSACLAAAENGKGKGKGGKPDGKGVSPGRGQDARFFRNVDHAPLLRYYNGRRDLPPGLRKKYYRTGTLPPGWEKKIQPFPPELVRVLPPLPANCDRGYIEGVAVVYDRTTRVILDAIDIVAAIKGY